MEKSCRKCKYLGLDQKNDWTCGKKMVEQLEKALKNDGMVTDCPAYEFEEGMTFEDRAKRLIKDVMKSGGEKEGVKDG